MEKSSRADAGFLADYQHFTDIIPGKKEFDGSEVTEQGFYMAVIEYALQLETI